MHVAVLTILYGATTVVGLRIEASFSSFSGLVANVDVGTPSQHLRMAIDFSAADSLLFHPRVCPAFVGDCFNRDLSRTAVREEPCGEGNSDDSVGWSASSEITDMVRLADSEWSAIRFWNADEIDPVSVALRDVHGLLAFDRQSQLAEHRVMRLASTADDRIVLESIEPGVELGGNALIGDQWSFMARLALSGMDLPEVLVTFDPAGHISILPETYKDPIVRILETQGIEYEMRRGEPMPVHCDSDLVLSLILAGEVEVKIPLTDKASMMDGFCKVNLAFHHKDYLSIGSQLLHAADSIVLDNVQGTIQITPRTDLRSTREPRILVPVFSAPMVSFASDGGIQIGFVATEERDGLILAHADPTVLERKAIVDFIRSVPDFFIADDNEVSFGRFEVDISVARDRVLIALYPAIAPAGYTLFITEHDDGLRLIMDESLISADRPFDVPVGWMGEKRALGNFLRELRKNRQSAHAL